MCFCENLRALLAAAMEMLRWPVLRSGDGGGDPGGSINECLGGEQKRFNREKKEKK